MGRDVRTVLRWEKERGLPVHRIPGPTGRVVFAYTHELDDWANGERQAAPTPSEWTDLPPVTAPVLLTHRSRRWHVTAALAVCAAALIARTALHTSEPPSLRLEVRPDAITALRLDGTTQWRHAFPAGEQAGLLATPEHAVAHLDSGYLAATVAENIKGTARGGQLYEFSLDGQVRRTFAFDDQMTLGGAKYGPPWALTAFRVVPTGGHRIAVAAHHYEWWTSMVTILDDEWNRRGTFVNAGWIEGLSWVDGGRLVVSGFSNPRNGGMIALLDAQALNGQSPPAGDQFTCESCASGRPLRYVVMPRSEVNRASFSRFNRAMLEEKPDGFLARTEETSVVQGTTGVADALYEFSRDLQLVRASYGDRYWDIHRQLEADGRLTHTREQCPDRDGPPRIEVWEPHTGWTSQRPDRNARR